MRRNLRGIVIAVVVVALAAVIGLRAWRGHRSAKILFRTSTVQRGDLSATITATGTVEPEEVVDVGAQVAGQLLEFGKDKDGKPIDYGSVVESNTLLAKIDPNLYAADVALGKAAVDSDVAGEASAEANVEQLKAKETQDEADWKRAQLLGPSEALAPTTYDSYKANYEIAKANVDLGVAALAQAKAATVQARATLDKAQRTLDYCTIVSPVKGVIIDRRVNIGETVVSSLNTPSLFLIAKDLKRMQVWVSVNEADIGSIVPDQKVSFTVDAFPNRVFQGTVGKVRLNASMTQNVVTYTVEVNTDNSDGKLLPYLTANVHFLTGERHDVFMVLNSALRWNPSTDLIDPADRSPEAGAAPGGAPSGARGGPRGGGGGDDAAVQQTGTLWAENGAFVRPIPVSLGLTDGTWTEVEGQGLSNGLTVVMGIQMPDLPEAMSGASPFVPQFGRRPQGGAGGGAGGAGGAGGGRGPGGPGGGRGGP